MPALRRLLHYQIYPKRKCHNGSATISAFDVHKFWVFLNFETTFPPSLLLPMLWNVSSCDGCGLAESSCSRCAHCAILSEHGWEGKIGKAVLRWPCKQEGNSGAPCSGRGFPRQFQVSWEHLWNPTSQLCCCSFTHCASFSLWPCEGCMATEFACTWHLVSIATASASQESKGVQHPLGYDAFT